MEKKKGIIFTLLGASFWGISGLFVRNLNSLGFKNIEILGIRLALSVIILSIILLIKDKKLFRIKLKDIWIFFGTGILSLEMFGICYYTTMGLTSISVAAILLYSSPAFVMILSAIIFKDKFTINKTVALFMTIGGVVLISGINSADTLSTKALFFGLMSGFGYALYSIFSTFAFKRGYSSLTITFYTFLFGTLGTIFFCSPTHILAQTSVQSVLWNFGSAIFTTVVPYIFYTLGVKHLKASTAALTATLEPVVATVISVCVLKETITPMQIGGIILIITAIFVTNIKFGKREKTDEQRNNQQN